MGQKGKNIAIIVAAGKGKRMGQGFNKQYILLKKKPIIAHTLTVFEESEYIDEILLVVGENEINFTTENIIKKYGFKKVIQVISGGKERQDSVYAGLLAIKDLCEIVLIHDGARPFLEKKLIQKTIDVAKNMGAAITGMPVKDTIKIINDKMEVVDTPDRSQLWGVQTPQAFQYRLLKSAYDNIMTEGVFVTDDAMALERYGHAVAVVQGSYENIKITTPEDLLVAESILRREK
ncbi:2-C-methyl-D-erythritol 4-phosphate cytidylyltransferase [Clostridium formicaceticum]|uniref:2-C-methyl-D-erythritol 4-phosphate cytidylyltransferase n=2 Tax=Clostridium formicaceticum TaxID=1497 RepID=A0AAC9RQE7_9CLOT|nr:2-C-methyl-D-erythritol 4-phosphate cytidylyltransferase [Clostridium formicaceticum]ARE89557.1 2-C-methyl-D-erythritol 4-phosphate cytidylyltransferase 1 [Clostridium formicaceticum]